jgi:hypothetical protein
MSAKSKRRWREQNSERYATYERERAQARRSGRWGSRFSNDAQECLSSDSYYRYERSGRRLLQKMNHSRWGSNWRTIIALPVQEQVRLAQQQHL